MGKDTDCVLVESREPTSEDLKPVVAEESGDSFPDMIGQNAAIVTPNKQFDSERYSDVLGKHSDSTYFVGESVIQLYAIASDKRQTTYSEQNLPIHSESDTFVLPETTHDTFASAIASCNDSLLLDLGDDLPNECAPIKKRGILVEDWKVGGPQLVTMVERIFMHMAYVQPNNEKPRCIEYGGGGNSSSKGSQTESGGGGGGAHGTCVTGFSATSLLVTGMGGGGGLGGGDGGDEDPWRYQPTNLPRSHYADYVPTDDINNDAQRHVVMASATPMELGMDPMAFFNRPDSVPFFLDDDLPEVLIHTPVQTPQTPAQTPTQPMQETSSDIADSFDLIHLMKLQRPSTTLPRLDLTSPYNPKPQRSLFVPSHHWPSYASVPSPSSTPSPSPSTLSPAPTPSSMAPSTPVTPQNPASLFRPNSYVRDDKRICELIVPQDIPQEKRGVLLRALYFSAMQYWKYMQCLQQPCDLKVANETQAKLCGFNFEPEQSKLVFSMPSDCKPLDIWLEEHKEAIDVRDRLLILQQVINTLAAIHTLGNEELLSFWGGFMVWVGEDKQVYLLIDFPIILQKQQQFQVLAAMAGSDNNPRLEDVKAVHALYCNIVKPFIGHDSSWVSPGMDQMLQSFEALLGDSSSSSRMAEIARTMGGRRTCKMEVDMVTLPVAVYCLEHEPLPQALQMLRIMVPMSTAWCVRWSFSKEMVQCSDLVSGNRHMLLELDHVSQPADDNGLYINSDFPPMGFHP